MIANLGSRYGRGADLCTRRHIGVTITATPSRTCAGLCTDVGIAQAYREHHTVLLAHAVTVLRDRGLAEEAVQETFLRAWRACESFNPNGPPRMAWLRAILRNIMVDLIRARAVRPALPVAAIESDDPSPRVGEVDRLLIRAQLAQALSEISPTHRRVVVDTIVHDRPHREVAAMLGIPIGTVKSRLHAALRNLRDVLETAS